MSLEDILSSEDLATLDKMQSIRTRIIDSLIIEDKLPEDKNDRDFLLETMKDTDKSIFTKSRLKVANKSADNDRSANMLIAELLAKHTVSNRSSRDSIPELDKDIKLENTVPGEMEIGIDAMSYDQFIK